MCRAQHERKVHIPATGHSPERDGANRVLRTCAFSGIQVHQFNLLQKQEEKKNFKEAKQLTKKNRQKKGQ